MPFTDDDLKRLKECADWKVFESWDIKSLLARLKAAESERDRLKAELEEAWGKNGASLRAWMREKGAKKMWKSRAENLAEALRQAVIMLPCGGPTMRPCTSCDIKDALSDYEKEVGK